jgi:hypothetical protein
MAVWIDSVIRSPRLSAIWTRVVERLLRFWPTYPPDWQLRRMLVFERAHGRCDGYGWPVGTLREMDDGWRMVKHGRDSPGYTAASPFRGGNASDEGER